MRDLRGERLRIARREIFPDGGADRFVLDDDKAPRLAQAHRRREASELDQRFQSAVRQWIGPEAPNVAPPDQQIAQARAERVHRNSAGRSAAVGMVCTLIARSLSVVTHAGQRNLQPAPVRLRPPGRPKRSQARFREDARQNSGAAEMMEQCVRRLRPRQPKQCRAADDVKTGPRSIASRRRRGLRKIAPRLLDPRRIGQRFRADRERRSRNRPRTEQRRSRAASGGSSSAKPSRKPARPKNLPNERSTMMLPRHVAGEARSGRR